MRYKRQETGNFLQLWEVFLSSLETSGAKERARKFLAGSGAKRETIEGWLHKKTSPSGVYLVKLWYLFQDNGDEITNIAGLFPEVQELGHALARKKTNFEEIHRALGYGRKANTLKVLQGVNTPSTDKRKRIRGFLNKSKDGVTEKSFDADIPRVYARNNAMALLINDMQKHVSPMLMFRFACELDRIIPVLEELAFHKDMRVRTDIHKILGEEFERFQRLVRALASEDARAKILSEEGFQRFYARDAETKSKGGE